MNRNNPSPVLAIGIDSADAMLVRRMIEHEELPSLKSLLAEGKWISIQSPTRLGTTSVWPTFMTGEDPEVHGIYSESCWEPKTMSLSPFTGEGIKPFWKALAEADAKVGILAIPFMPLVGMSDGFEISESDPYTLPGDGSGPTGVPGWATKTMVQDSLSHGRINVSGPDDLNNLQKLALDSLAGIKLRGKFAERLLMDTRPDFSIIVFTEAHESGHCLWQTIEPEHPLYIGDAFNRLASIRPTLKDIYQEVDRQIGRLVQAVGASARILVFSLHGMQPSLAVPTFLSGVLCEMGFSRLADSKNLSWAQRAVGLMRAVKRRMPDG
jgi:predicted AlkP superfamily phosphohydrolase/phosphomutase